MSQGTISLVVVMLFGAIAGRAQPSDAEVRSHDSLTAHALDSLLRQIVTEGPSVGGLHHIVLPTEVSAGYRTRSWLRDWIASSDVDDLTKVDLIYLRALAECNGRRSEALLATAIALLEHRFLPTPIGLLIPLTLESQEEFQKRIAHLPRHLFVDNVAGDDRDKLQHFFASAWLASSLDNGGVADAIGDAVEVGEDLFIPGGIDDPRDRRANRLGQLFAHLLERYPDILPGDLFRAWNRRQLQLNTEPSPEPSDQ